MKKAREVLLRLFLACLSSLSFARALATHFVPDPATTNWQYQLSDSGKIKYIPEVNLYVIDLDTARDEIPRLKSLNKDARVVCYWSAGTYEAARRKNDQDRGSNSFDSKSYLKDAMVEPMVGWPGETWLDVTNKRVWWANKKRMLFAKDIGCDGVDPDNVDYYSVNSKVNTRREAAAFVEYLVTSAHDLGLGVGLKNAVELIEDVPEVDWYINESCVTFKECDVYKDVARKKAVLAVEYCDAKEALDEPTQDPSCVCATARKYNINMLIKRADLGWERFACRDRMFIQGQFGRLEFTGECASTSKDVCSTAFN